MTRTMSTSSMSTRKVVPMQPQPTIRKTAFYSPEVWAKLRARLFRENLTFAQWAREQADAYLAEGKAK